jgi:hypothetical protein
MQSTQSGQNSSSPSQNKLGSQPPVPPFHAPNRQHTAEIAVLETLSHPEFKTDENVINRLHTELAQKSSGLSVEQLEQVNSAIMDAIWKQRGDWDRVKVTRSISTVFNDIVNEIEELQTILPASIDRPEHERTYS